MALTFDPKTFLTCPQGPQLVGKKRVQACLSLGVAISKGHFVTAAELLVKDPSLITEDLPTAGGEMKSAVSMAIVSGMEPLVLFALTHGMPPESTAFGAQGGLLAVAVHLNSPGLVSCALLYRATPDHSSPFTTTAGVTFQGCSLLGQAFATACLNNLTPTPTKQEAAQIVRMLLDAGASPVLSGADNSWLAEICQKKSWSTRQKEIAELFSEVLNRGGPSCVNLSFVTPDPEQKTLIRIAAEAGNRAAVRCLIDAGAEMDTKELGEVLRTALESNGARHSNKIAEVVDLLHRRNLAPPKAAPPPPASLNLAPESLFDLQPGPQLIGTERDKWRSLLEMAIKQGKFVTATKVIARDRSLIAEPAAVWLMINAGMHALLPMALAPCMEMDDPVFAPRKLLSVAVESADPSLASYALLYGADPDEPDQREGKSSTGKLPLRFPSLLEGTILNACTSSNSNIIKNLVSIAGMLIDTGNNQVLLQPENTALSDLCYQKWPGTTEQFNNLFGELLNRGGIACVDKLRMEKPLLRLAAETQNIAAIKQLIVAGANTDLEFLGGDLFAILKESGGAEHIPALSELLMQRQIAQAEAEASESSVTIVAGPADHDAAQIRRPRLTAKDVF